MLSCLVDFLCCCFCIVVSLGCLLGGIYRTVFMTFVFVLIPLIVSSLTCWLKLRQLIKAPKQHLVIEPLGFAIVARGC